jgi:predicted acetyltransferase
MGLAVRTIDAADIYGWVRCMGMGFLFGVADGYAEYLLGDVDLARTWGAFDGEVVVGTLRSFPTPFTVPGPTQVRANALTNVTVAPTHRRAGLLTEMITNELRAARSRGEAIGILIASEYPIYGRFGYGAAVEGSSYRVDVSAARFRHRAPGTVEMVDLAALRKDAPAIYDRFRAAQPGSIERNARWWDRALHQVEVPGARPAEGYQAVYRSPTGSAEGYVRYRASQKWDHMRKRGDLTIDELVATSDSAYARLWQHCCEVDLVTSVHAGDRPVDETVPWLLDDGRAVQQSGRFDFVWVRVIDVASALAGRRYAVEGRLVIDVTDTLGLTGGRFALEGGPSGATCAPSDDAPDLSMPVSTLGSLYAGGVSADALWRAGRVDELRVGSVARAALMFRCSPAPWCNTWF